MSTLLNAPAVLGTKKTKPAPKPSGAKLPATGVGTGMLGFALLGVAAVLGRRLRSLAT
jgi:LPXTG-motif cell wall-anchored protein